MLPLQRNDGMEPKRRLAYATEFADFYRMKIVARKTFESGAKREGRSGFRKQDIFFLALTNCSRASRNECSPIERTHVNFVFKVLRYAHGGHLLVGFINMYIFFYEWLQSDLL